MKKMYDDETIKIQLSISTSQSMVSKVQARSYHEPSFPTVTTTLVEVQLWLKFTAMPRTDNRCTSQPCPGQTTDALHSHAQDRQQMHFTAMPRTDNRCTSQPCPGQTTDAHHSHAQDRQQMHFTAMPRTDNRCTSQPCPGQTTDTLHSHAQDRQQMHFTAMPRTDNRCTSQPCPVPHFTAISRTDNRCRFQTYSKHYKIFINLFVPTKGAYK